MLIENNTVCGQWLINASPPYGNISIELSDWKLLWQLKNTQITCNSFGRMLICLRQYKTKKKIEYRFCFKFQRNKTDSAKDEKMNCSDFFVLRNQMLSLIPVNRYSDSTRKRCVQPVLDEQRENFPVPCRHYQLTNEMYEIKQRCVPHKLWVRTERTVRSREESILNPNQTESIDRDW